MAINTIKSGKLEYLTAENIAATHCFTTRRGGVSTGALESLNIGLHRGDDPENVVKNYDILAKALDFDASKLVLTRQTHSDIVRVVTAADCNGLDHHQYPESDALVTNTPGVGLVIFTADCTPILFHDPVTGAVGAVHAGWRGTASGIVKKAVEAMANTYGCRAENICAAIGPNIGPCCFETDRDVPEAMLAAFGDDALPFIREKGQKFYVNLKELNALWLRRSGVSVVDISTHCTACERDLYWSHRRTGPARGSQGAIIVC